MHFIQRKVLFLYISYLFFFYMDRKKFLLEQIESNGMSIRSCQLKIGLIQITRDLSSLRL